MSGPAVVGVTLADDPAAWGTIGLPTHALGALQLSWVNGTDGLVGWTLAGESGPAALDGIRTRWTRTATPADHDTPDPLGVTEADHVVVMTPDVTRTAAALQDAGMRLRLLRDAGTPERPLRQAFFRHGECRVEVVGPAEGVDDGGPARLWGLTLVVADLDGAAAQLGQHASGPRSAVQPGRRIVTVRRSAGLSVPLALMDAEPQGEGPGRG